MFKIQFISLNKIIVRILKQMNRKKYRRNIVGKGDFIQLGCSTIQEDFDEELVEILMFKVGYSNLSKYTYYIRIKNEFRYL